MTVMVYSGSARRMRSSSSTMGSTIFRRGFAGRAGGCLRSTGASRRGAFSSPAAVAALVIGEVHRDGLDLAVLGDDLGIVEAWTTPEWMPETSTTTRFLRGLMKSARLPAQD